MPEAESSNKAPSIPWAPLLALVAAVASLAALLPSRSSRPLATGGESVRSPGGDVSARLWQDPFSVAREAEARRRRDSAASTPTPTPTLGTRSGEGAGEPVEWSFFLDLKSSAPLPQEDLSRQYHCQRLIKTWGQPPLVLVVCEPGSPYAEDVERRLRDRVAVIHALAARGYVPEESTALHYDMVTKKRDKPLPFEIFLRRFPSRSLDPLPPAALVVWLADEGVEGPGPLAQLAWLSQTIPEIYSQVPMLRVLGPSNSQQYRRMLEEAGTADRERDKALADTRIYSCKASAAEDVLTAGVYWPGVRSLPAGVVPIPMPSRKSDQALTRRVRANGGAGFSLTRTIRPDDELAAALWRELRRRQVKAGNYVAAIAELDSFYGRASTLAFLHTYPDKPGSKPPEPLDPLDLEGARQRAQGNHVLTYAHLAGIDGALPKNALGAEDRTSKDTSGASKPGTVSPTQEPTEGLGQVDYLRRLANELASEDRQRHVGQSSWGGAEPGIAAVAVLGSDIYDKLQILRTLRPRLPGALFLTLNLDARFEHPDEWEATRNLLVASNYALTPRSSQDPRDPQDWEAPPFRDSDQAAVYAAARLALAADSLPGDPERWLGQPHLFEIGRGGPVPLPTECDPIVPEHPGIRGLTWPKVSWFAAFALPLVGLCWMGSVSSDRRRRWFERSGIAVPVALTFSFVVTLLRYHGQRFVGEEPFAPWDGISIWPGDFLRLGAVALSLHLAAKTFCVLGQNRDDLQERFDLLPREKEGSRAPAAGDGWRGRRPGPRLPLRWGSWTRGLPSGGYFRTFSWGEWQEWGERLRRGGGQALAQVRAAWQKFWPHPAPSLADGARVQVQALWGCYRNWSRPDRRLGRALLLAGLYFLAFRFLMGLANEPWPHLPARGSAYPATVGILVLSAVCSLVVTFLVVDATQLNSRFIRDLNAGATDWDFLGTGRRHPRFGFKPHLECLEPEDLAEYLDIELIARRSAAVNHLIYYPCILITLLVAARWSVTDDYLWSPALLMAFGANSAWALYCAIRLPIEANRARAKSLERLRQRLFVRRCAKDSGGPEPARSSVAALEGVIGQIEHMNRGAFVNIWDQPALRALLVPSGGAGLWALLEFLAR